MSHGIQSERKNPERKPVAYAFFAGAGGMHLGMEKAGFDVALASDLEPSAEATHKLNWPNLPFLCKDIQKVTAKELVKLAGGRKPDIIVGGPPCQGFSTIGTKLSSDPRNRLFETYARLVAELEPQCVVIENVKAITTMYDGKFRDHIIEMFGKLGYTMYLKVLDAAEYGVPQHRYRAIFVGTRIDYPFKFPTPTHGESAGKKFETVGNAIMDLVRKTEKQVPNHAALEHSETVVRRYKLIPEGGKLPSPDKLPREIRRKNFGNTYKRLHRNETSLTMVPGNNAFPIHPTANRSLTPREAARIQTFPDSFVFAGDRRRQCILVGNAVPPHLAETIGKSLMDHIQGKVTQEEADRPTVISQSTQEITKKLDLNTETSQGFIDLFSGAGGFLIGFENAGWKPLLGADWDKDVAQTHRSNHPHVPFVQGDLGDRKVQKQITEQFKGKDVGLIVGGPPCQGFSVFGKRRFVNTQGYDIANDKRNRLVYAYLEIVKTIKPRWFLMENVPGLASIHDGKLLDSLIASFKKAGYTNTEYRIVNAADYGVPQKRRRLIIMGNRTGNVIPWPKRKFFESPEDWQDPYRSVGEVITDLASPSAYHKYTCHVPMNHKPLLVERYELIPEGGKLDDKTLPKHLIKGYRTDRVKNYSHIYKRLHRDEPASTMVAGHNAFPIHPWIHRSLTVREAARIQTFPDKIEFKGNRQSQCIQVGNAFPPLLAEVIANNIKKAEVNGWYPGKVAKSAYYALVEHLETPASS